MIPSPRTTLRRSARLAAALAALTVAALAHPAAAGSIENLERERALLIEAFLSAELAPEDRPARIAESQRRLVDLERIALRDEELGRRPTPAVRQALANYDLTFLVHAASERDTGVLDHWFDQIGVSTQTLMSAQRRRR